MAWAKAHIEIKPASVGTGVKASLKRTNKSAARLSLTISSATGEGLGWSGGDKIEVMIGEGEHHGLIRLRKNNSAGQAELAYREMARGAWFSLRLGHQPAFVDRSESAAWCQWEKVEDGWIEVVLPTWADETAPSQKPTRQPPAATAPTPARGANVTAALMGDPEPGRREQVEKLSRKQALERAGRIKA